MIKKFKIFFKNFKFILMSLVIILYSLELLSVIFLKKQNNFVEITFETLRNEKIEKIKDFDKRGNYAAFHEEKEENNLSPSFRYAEWHLYNGDYENKIKNFINKNIEKNKKIPFRGPINRKSLGDNEDGFREIISNDKYGYKNLNNFYNNQIDLMILGDSFAEGIPFDGKNDISGKIRERSNYNSLNFGVSGTGPLISLAIIKEYGKELKPRNIFYLFYEGNDLNDLMIEKNTFLINYLNDFDQNLINSRDEIKIFLNEYEKIFNEILPYKIEKEKNIKKPNTNSTNKTKEKIKNFLELNTLKEIIFPSSVFNRSKIDYNLFTSVISNMNKNVKDWDGNFYFVYLPSWTRYNNIYSVANLFHKNKILNSIKDLKIPIIDIDNTFKKNNFDNINTYNLGMYGHYTKEGYSLIADQLIKVLNDN